MTERHLEGPITEEQNQFTPAEHAVLSHYFDLPNYCPTVARHIDPRQLVDPKTWNEGELGIAARKFHPVDPSWELDPDTAIKEAVARIALETVQDTQLNDHSRHSLHGEPIPQREIVPIQNRPRRPGVIIPQFLFGICWCINMNGDWPEWYYAAAIPYYDQLVLTASFDGIDCHSVNDIAIGHFPIEDSFEKSVQTAICNWWKYMASCNQEEWQYLVDIADIEGLEPDKWAAGIDWPEF